MKSLNPSTTLTEELLGQDLESDLTRIILTVQSVVNIINNKLSSDHSDSAEQLVTWANQVWLDKLIKSRAVRMMVTKLASSMLEVDTENQGQDCVLVAFDPLTLGQGLDLVASSTFAVWRRCRSEEVGEESISDLFGDSESLICGGLITYGMMTRALIGGQTGASLYHLEQGQLVTARQTVVSNCQVLSLPADNPGKLSQIMTEIVIISISRSSASRQHVKCNEQNVQR